MLRCVLSVGLLVGIAGAAGACDQVQVVAPAAVVSPFAIVPQVVTAPLFVSAGDHQAVVTVAAAPVVVQRQRPVVVRSRTVVRRGLFRR